MFIRLNVIGLSRPVYVNFNNVKYVSEFLTGSSLYFDAKIKANDNDREILQVRESPQQLFELLKNM